MNFYLLFLQFCLYSIIGWICEVIFCSIPQKRFVNRGVLRGPWCPIYGFGGLLLSLSLTPLAAHPLLCYLLGVLLTSALEYLTSYLLERYFHAKLWDYSDHRVQLHGRICLLNSSLFGLLALALVYLIQPLFHRLIGLIPEQTIPVVSTVLLVLFSADVTAGIFDSIQFKALLRRLHELGEQLEMRQQNRRDDASRRVHELLEAERQRLHRTKHTGRRLLKAIPTMSSNRFGDPLERLRALLHEKHGK